MARHRNVRTMNFDDDYEGYYDVYGRSQEEDACVSPSTEAQFLYNRDKLHSMSSFLSPGVLTEENESNEEEEGEGKGPDGQHSPSKADSSCTIFEPGLTPEDEVKLYECLEKMQNVVGDSIPESTLRKVAIEANFNAERALDKVLTETEAPKPQREAQQGRRERRHPQPLDKIAEQRRPLGQGAEALPLNPALRQTFAAKQMHEAEVKPAPKNGTENTLLAPNNEVGDSNSGSSRNSPSSDDNPESTDGTSEPVGDNLTSKTPSKPKSSGKDAQSEYNRERGSAKPLLNLVVIGHVDAGKSTLMGHLLYRLGCVQKKLMHKYEQDSKKLGKASFMYAWVLDETAEERNRGITMDIAQAKFETPSRSIVLLDAPGHKDFIPNMITGAAQADVAILVVDATRGEFETGFETGGQTREHTLLVRSLGVSQLAVAINKLDNVGWEKSRYEEITTKLRAFLKQAGYRESDFTFVPCSGLTGENLIEPSSEDALCSWYDGPYLVKVIDSFKPPERPVAKPFRLCVSDVFKGTGSGPCVSGRIEAGAVANGDKVLLMPAAEQGTVKGVTVNEVPTQQAFAGDQVALTLAGVDVMKVMTGSFLCDPVLPIRVTSKFQARIVVFNVEIPITRGFPVVLHYQSMSEQASVHKLISQLHKTTGEVVRNKPRCLTKNSSGMVEIKVSRPICVELYKEFKELGRVTLRSGGSTVAAGVITAIT